MTFGGLRLVGAITLAVKMIAYVGVGHNTSS